MTCEYLKKNKIFNALTYGKVFRNNGKRLLINCFKKISGEKNSLEKKVRIDNLGSKRIANYILGKEFNKA